MDQLEVLMLDYPIIRTLAVVMIVSRLVFKPIFTLVAKYVELTVETEDDSKLAKIMESKWYRLAAFALDLTLSIKLVQKKKD